MVRSIIGKGKTSCFAFADDIPSILNANPFKKCKTFTRNLAISFQKV